MEGCTICDTYNHTDATCPLSPEERAKVKADREAADKAEEEAKAKKLAKLKIPGPDEAKEALKLIEAQLKLAEKHVKEAAKIAKKAKVPFKYHGETFAMFDAKEKEYGADPIAKDLEDLDYMAADELPEQVTMDWWAPSSC
jgi:hypothetical protein